MAEVTYTPSEFAALFGKERTWAYRQLYKGNVQAITQLGRTLIPKSEVDRLLKEAGRYLGAKAKVGKSKKDPSPTIRQSEGAKNWADALKSRKTRGGGGAKKSSAAKGCKSTQASNGASVRTSLRQSVLQRLTKPKVASVT